MFVSSLILLAGSAALVVADGCHGDNLLRAMERHNGTMYCSMLLDSGDATATLSLPDPIPTSYPDLSVSSAVSCTFPYKNLANVINQGLMWHSALVF